jgi:hypothetical protein
MNWKREILGEWIKHDDDSCNALREYDSTVDHVIGISPFRYMEKIAGKYNTTIPEMKNHWECIDREERLKRR